MTANAAGERFGYDGESHQTEFFNANNSGSTPDGTYAYDGEGKRVKKETSSETTIFVYDAAGKVVAEYSTALATTPQVSYLTQDHLGSPRVTTNENGEVTNRKDFAAFGDEVVSAQRVSGNKYASTPDEVRQDYTGYEKDEESGLEFAQARYYNPTHGRFTSVDPLTASATIRDPQSFNRYSYGLNSPYKFTDPLGLLSETATGACGGRCSNSDPGAITSFSGSDTMYEGLLGGVVRSGIYFIMQQVTNYYTASTYLAGTANITVATTQTWLSDVSGNAVTQRTGSASTTITSSSGYNATQLEQIKTIATATANAAMNIGIDVATFLGIVRAESEFGMVRTGEGPRKNALSNPSQYSGGRAKIAGPGSPEYATALQYNLEQSIIHVYNWAEKKSGGNLWQLLYLWNGNSTIEKNGREQRVNFADKTSGYVNGIKGSMSVGPATRTGYFDSLFSPSGIPSRGVVPCSLATPICNR